MRPLLVLGLALALVGVAVPTASAHFTFGFDLSGDRDCDDPGETVAILGPDPEWLKTHQPCAVLA